MIKITENMLENDMHYLDKDDFDDLYTSDAEQVLKALGKPEDEDSIEDIKSDFSMYYVTQSSLTATLLAHYYQHLAYRKGLKKDSLDMMHDAIITFKPTSIDFGGDGLVTSGFIFMHKRGDNHDDLLADLVMHPISFLKWSNAHIGTRKLTEKTAVAK